jgi:hypothetical protein
VGWKSIALLATVFVAAGCGSTKAHPTTRSSASPSKVQPGSSVVTPGQVERTFAAHRVRLVENYPNARPGPIVRADYRLVGKGAPDIKNKPNGWVTVYDSARHAAVAERRFGTIYGKQNVAVRANVLVEFLRDADRSARQRIRHALSAVAR